MADWTMKNKPFANYPRSSASEPMIPNDPPPPPADVAGLIAHANKVRMCIHIAADEPAAKDVDETIGKLVAALAALAQRPTADEWQQALNLIDHYQEARDTAERDLAEAREDVERYRYIRAVRYLDIASVWLDATADTPEEFDAAIDAARKGKL